MVGTGKSIKGYPDYLIYEDGTIVSFRIDPAGRVVTHGLSGERRYIYLFNDKKLSGKKFWIDELVAKHFK